MENPSQEKAETLAAQVVAPERLAEVREIHPLPGLPPLSQIREWSQRISADRSNWEPLVPVPARGWSPVTTQGITESGITYGVACEEYIPVIREAMQNRLSALNIPRQMVDFRAQERAYPAIMGVNKLEECWPPHPAGFGGYYHIDPSVDDTNVYVYLLHPSQEAAEEAMKYQLPYRRDLKVHSLQGQFTFNQLEDWLGKFVEDIGQHQKAALKLGTGKGTTLRSAKTDPRFNRLRFLIREDADVPATRQAIEERLTALDIPLEAVIIEVEPPR